MKAAILALGALLLLPVDDDFQRERKGRDTDQVKDAMEGGPPPALVVDSWTNTGGEALPWEALEGKVVLVKFWGVWCGPCVRSMPEQQALHEELADDGLVVLGVHSERRADEMAAFMADHGYTFPTCADSTGATAAEYAVDGWPDYYLIGRDGNVVVADLANGDVGRAVRLLLAEGAESAAETIVAREPLARFSVHDDGGETGVLTLRNEIVELAGSPALHASNVAELGYEGETETISLDFWCAVDGTFSIRRIDLTIGAAPTQRYGATPDGEGGLVLEGEAGESIALPENTVPFLLVPRVVVGAPLDAEWSRTFTLFDTDELRTEGEHRLACVGPEEREVTDGEPRTVWRYTLFEVESEEPMAHFVVDEGHRVLSCDMGGGKGFVRVD